MSSINNPDAMHHVSAFILENGSSKLLKGTLKKSIEKKVSMNPNDAIFCGAYTSGDGLMLPHGGSGEFDEV